MKLKFPIVLVFIAEILSCGKDQGPQYPIIPQITFKDYVFNRQDVNGLVEDSYTITFEYIDGDGDIGMSDTETSLPGNPNIKHVVFVDYYEKNKTGVYKKVACALGSDTTTKKYRIPIITPPGNNKAIKGEMQVKVLPCPVPLDTTKVIKYSMYIYDRAAHKSNVVESPDIYYQTQTK